MKVLVTGSEGYIGIILVQKLLEKGYDVTGLDTGFYKNGWLYNGVSKTPYTITKDIRQITTKDLKGFDTVFHLAELSNDPLGERDPKITYRVNHLGTAELINNAKSAGVKRFIYFSSCSVYGTADQEVTEESKTNPLTEYAKCKLLNEKYLQKVAGKNFTPVILRNSTVFGASPRLRFDLVVNNLTGIAFTTGEIKMTSDGSPWRPLVDITDISRAAILAMEAPKKIAHNQIFNVGGRNSNYQVKDVAQKIARIMPKCKLTFGSNPGDKRDYKVNFEKIEKVLGFKTQVKMEDSIRNLLQIYKKAQLTEEIFYSREYTRIKQLNFLQESGQVDKNLYWRKRNDF